jgi:hypothetical protein
MPVSNDSTPAVVWLFRADDDKANQACNANIFQNEQVGIALKKFRCYRVDVDAIPDDRVRKEYEKQSPAFFFFDPAGEKVASAVGRRATSLSGFSSAMERTWNTSFTVKLRGYTKKMTRILDRMDRLDGQKQILSQNKARLAQKPNPRKQREVDQEEKQLKEAEAKVLEDEQKILESVALRPQYVPEKEKVAKSD